SSPYSYPVGYGYDPYYPYLAPSRRAGLMMILMGSLMLLSSLCCGVVLLAPVELMQQQLNVMQQQTNQTLSIEMIRIGAIVTGLFLAGCGLPLIVLGTFVRRGSSGATIAGIVITCIVILLSAFMTVGSRMMIVPLALFVLQLIWLIKALRSGAALR